MFELKFGPKYFYICQDTGSEYQDIFYICQDTGSEYQDICKNLKPTKQVAGTKMITDWM